MLNFLILNKQGISFLIHLIFKINFEEEFVKCLKKKYNQKVFKKKKNFY